MARLSGIGNRLYSGETSFNIINNRKRWYSISAVFIVISFGALVFQGLHLGIEFKGGSSYTVNKSGISVEEARSTVEATGIEGGIIVQKIGDDKVRIQTGTLTSAQSTAIENALSGLRTAHTNKDVDSITTAIETLNAAWQTASTELYNSTAAPETPEAETTQTDATSSNDTNVEDVEFEEVK